MCMIPKPGCIIYSVFQLLPGYRQWVATALAKQLPAEEIKPSLIGNASSLGSYFMNSIKLLLRDDI